MTGEGTRTFGKDGGDLLSRLRSTIGAVGLNFSVRNGKRWNTNAIATRMGDMTDNPDASEHPHTGREPGMYLAQHLHRPRGGDGRAEKNCRTAARRRTSSGRHPTAARLQVSGN